MTSVQWWASISSRFIGGSIICFTVRWLRHCSRTVFHSWVDCTCPVTFICDQLLSLLSYTGWPQSNQWTTFLDLANSMWGPRRQLIQTGLSLWSTLAPLYILCYRSRPSTLHFCHSRECLPVSLKATFHRRFVTWDISGTAPVVAVVPLVAEGTESISGCATLLKQLSTTRLFLQLRLMTSNHTDEQPSRYNKRFSQR